MSLLYIDQQFTIYCGSCLLLISVVGNGMNIWIFSSTRIYYVTPCTFYFLVTSILNIFYTLINISLRIMSEGYGIDPTQVSNIWCKIRQYLLVTLSIISTTCSCLPAIDQYLVTSQYVSLRRLSNIKWARRLIFIISIIWCLHGISVLYFYNIPPNSKTCVNENTGFSVYASVYLLGFICLMPIVTISMFGWLTYRNIQKTMLLVNQHFDRQLVRMALIQVGLVFISLVPYSIYIAYTLITTNVTKSIDREVKEYFAYTILSMTTYLFYIICLLKLFL